MEWAHGHAETEDRVINLIGGRTLQNNLACLTGIACEHAVADKARGVARQHRDLIQRTTEFHRGSNDFLARVFAANHFEQFHHIGGAEEVQADHGFGSAGGCRHLIDVQPRRIAGQHSTGLRHSVHFLEGFHLDVDIFVDGFDDHIDVRNIGIVCGASNQRHALIDFLRAHATALNLDVVVFLDDAQAAIERFLVHFHRDDGNSNIEKGHGDAAAHGAAANDGCAGDI